MSGHPSDIGTSNIEEQTECYQQQYGAWPSRHLQEDSIVNRQRRRIAIILLSKAYERA